MPDMRRVHRTSHRRYLSFMQHKEEEELLATSTAAPGASSLHPAASTPVRPSPAPQAPRATTAVPPATAVRPCVRKGWIGPVSARVRVAAALTGRHDHTVHVQLHDERCQVSVRAHVIGWNPGRLAVLAFKHRGQHEFRTVPARCIPAPVATKLDNTLRRSTATATGGRTYGAGNFSPCSYGRAGGAGAFIVLAAKGQDKVALPLHGRVVNSAMRDVLLRRVYYTEKANGTSVRKLMHLRGAHAGNTEPLVDGDALAYAYDLGGHCATVVDATALRHLMRDCRLLPYLASVVVQGEPNFLDTLQEQTEAETAAVPGSRHRAEHDGMELTLAAQGLRLKPTRHSRARAAPRMLACAGQWQQVTRWREQCSCRCGLTLEQVTISKRMRATACGKRPRGAAHRGDATGPTEQRVRTR